MPVLTLISKLNSHLATPLLRHGLSLRVALGGGVIRPSPYLDYLSLVPWAQKLVSGEVHHYAQQKREERQREPSALDVFVDRAWDRLGLEDASRALNAPPPPTPAAKERKYGASDQESKRGKGKGRRRKNRRMQQDVECNDAEESCTNPQLESLEGYLRPALVPNERWEDIPSRWYFNTPFVKWARLEYLKAKYGEDVSNTLLLPKYSEELSAMLPGLAGNDAAPPDRPPSVETITKAFQMTDWTRQKDADAVSNRVKAITKKLGGIVVPIPGSAILYPEIPDGADTASLSLEDILELGGGHVANCGPFNYVCEQAGIYEFWTKEYVAGLAAYLMDRAEEKGADGNTIILDVGAGDGTLAHFLRSALEAPAAQGVHVESKLQKSVPTVVATDDGSWKIRPRFEVENIGVGEAVTKYRQMCDQLIVLCSWMPMGVDWTADIRANGADEIILIGECDDGNCGDNWLTWGNPEFRDEMGEDEHGDSLLAPYRNDGYQRHDLDNLSKLQFSRFDSSVSSNSKTVSFRR